MATVRVDSNEEIGKRLELLRRAYSAAQGHKREMNKSEFARACGIGIQAWHNSESGYARIGLDNAMRLRTRTGAGLDFIYYDVRLGLPAAINNEIAQLEKSGKSRSLKRIRG